MTDSVRHPTLDELAAVDAEAVAGERAAALRRHVSGCAACAAALTELGRVRAVLRSAPIPPPPPGLAKRIDLALERAPGPEPAGRSARPIPPRRILAAAAAVTLVGVGVGTVAVLRGPGPSGSAGRPAVSAGQPAPRPLLAASGRDYTAAGLAGQVQALLNQSGPSGGRPSGPQPNTLAGPPPRPTPDSSALAGCLDAVGARAHRRVLAADVARFAGRPAIVVVLAGPAAGRVTVVVTAPGCRAGRPEIRDVFPGVRRG